METLKPNNAESTGNENNPWGEEYQKDIPPFNPEKSTSTDDGAIVEKMLEVDNDIQDELVRRLNQLKEGTTSGELEEELERYGGDEEKLAEDMRKELDTREKQQKILVDAREIQQSDPNLQGKSLEEILKAQSDKLSDYIDRVSETASEEKRQELEERKNNINIVAERVEDTRKYS